MSDHKFRYLLPPGNNFQFVSKFKAWLVMSIILMGLAIGALFFNKATRGEYMNWTIDFKGGTEMVFAFKDKSAASFTKVDPGEIRHALEKSGEDGIDVSEIGWTDEELYFAITVCALFNFYNRWIDATGVHALSDEAHRQGGKRMASQGYTGS